MPSKCSPDKYVKKKSEVRIFKLYTFANEIFRIFVIFNDQWSLSFTLDFLRSYIIHAKHNLSKKLWEYVNQSPDWYKTSFIFVHVRWYFSARYAQNFRETRARNRDIASAEKVVHRGNERKSFSGRGLDETIADSDTILIPNGDRGIFFTFCSCRTSIDGNKKVRKMAAGYDECYDSSWHLIPPDYVSNEEDYR